MDEGGVAASLSSPGFDLMILRAGLNCCTDGFDGAMFVRVVAAGVDGYMYLGVVCSPSILERRGRKNEREKKKAIEWIEQDRMERNAFMYVEGIKNASLALHVHPSIDALRCVGEPVEIKRDA